MHFSKAKLVVALLAAIGIPTTFTGFYFKYLKDTSELAVNGAEATELYKQCMRLRAKGAQQPQEAKVFLADMEKKLPEAVSAGSKLASLNTIADKSVSSSSIATELPKCVAELKKEISK